MRRENLIILLIAVWSFVFAQTVKAATLAEFVGDYDGQLLQWAALTALLGGVLRTIFSLQSDRRIVRDIAVEATWDAGKALVSGLTAFIVIQALRSSGWAIPSEVRFAAVIVAGWSRLAAVDWMFAFGKEWLEARKAQIVAKPTKDDT